MKRFRFHRLDGTVVEGDGRTVAAALARLGHGGGALRALDRWETVQPHDAYTEAEPGAYADRAARRLAERGMDPLAAWAIAATFPLTGARFDDPERDADEWVARDPGAIERQEHTP